MLSNEFDISTTEDRKALTQTIEKELIFCECCQTPFACKDHLEWTVRKLGALYPPNTTLLTFVQTRLFGKRLSTASNPPNRASRFAILCPDCRREAVFSS
jgi:hypothetical protein